MSQERKLRTFAPFVGYGTDGKYYIKPTDSVVFAYQPANNTSPLTLQLYTPPVDSVDVGWCCVLLVLPTFYLQNQQPVISNGLVVVKIYDTDQQLITPYQRGTIMLFRNAKSFGYFVDYRSFENCPGIPPT